MLGIKVGIDDMIGTIVGNDVGVVDELSEGALEGAEDGRKVEGVGRMITKDGGLTDVIPLTNFFKSLVISLLFKSDCRETTEWREEFVVTTYEKEMDAPKRLKRSKTFTESKPCDGLDGTLKVGETEGVRHRDGEDVGITDG